MTAASAPYELGQFETVTEVDDDGRGAVVSFPEREMVVWRNPLLVAQIREALDEAERGETVDLGNFSHYDTRTSRPTSTRASRSIGR